jgi:hypothetical protein
MAPVAVMVTIPLCPMVALTWSIAFPLPDVGDTMILGWLEEATQSTEPPEKNRLMICGLAATLLVPNVRDVGFSVMVIAVVGGTGDPDCAIDTVWPPTLRDPFLLCELVLAVTDQLTVLPMVRAEAQDTLELAVAGAQSAEDGVTEMVPADPAAQTVRLVALSAYEQLAADWIMTTFWPAIVSDPVLLWLPGLAGTDQLTVLPVADAVAQGTLELAVDAGQVLALGVTNMTPDEAVASTLRPVGLKV